MSEVVPQYGIGQLIHHKAFGYRGVVVDVDAAFLGTDAWYEAVAKSRPPKDKPWYYVLVHGASHMTYVAERNLKLDDEGGQIDHPALGQFFDRFDGNRYHPRPRRRS